MSALNVRELGSFIRDQRRGAEISLRQLAKQAGVSNPYLSQIERGLRKPSAEILQQIAKALRISAEVLYVQAGILDEREADGTGTTVAGAVLRDEHLSERQKQVLLEIYESFRRENEARTTPTPTPASTRAPTPTPTSTRASTPTPRSTVTPASVPDADPVPALPAPAAAVDSAVPPAGAATG